MERRANVLPASPAGGFEVAEWATTKNVHAWPWWTAQGMGWEDGGKWAAGSRLTWLGAKRGLQAWPPSPVHHWALAGAQAVELQGLGRRNQGGRRT